MGKMKATLPDYPTGEYMYDSPPEGGGNKWAMEQAIIACISLDTEPKEAYFARLKEYAKQILITLNELDYDIRNLDKS